jgi:hypothetical protein
MKMPQIEKIPAANPRDPYFRLWWEGGDKSWKERVLMFVNLFHRFLNETYGKHFYFELEDLAIAGDFRMNKTKIYIIFHCWFAIENQQQEDRFRKEWQEWMLLQEFEEEELSVLCDPKSKKYIWDAGTKLEKYQLVQPEDGKVQVLTTQLGYPPDSTWHKAGIYQGDGYFFFHNWPETYGNWMRERNKVWNFEEMKNALYEDDPFSLQSLIYALPSQ